jgi:hypothetical protein
MGSPPLRSNICRALVAFVPIVPVGWSRRLQRIEGKSLILVLVVSIPTAPTNHLLRMLHCFGRLDRLNFAYRTWISRESTVVGDQCDSLHDGLSQQNAVKGILVRVRQLACADRLLARD